MCNLFHKSRKLKFQCIDYKFTWPHREHASFLNFTALKGHQTSLEIKLLSWTFWHTQEILNKFEL